MKDASAISREEPLVIAVDLGGTQLRAALLQGARILTKIHLPTGDTSFPESIVERIRDCIEQILQISEHTLEQVAGLGVGVTGLLNSQTGVVFASANLAGWDHVPLREMLQKAYPGLSIFIENDANVAILAEHRFGAGQGCKDLVYLTISTGIGGGVICNNQLLVGASRTAAELGHMIIDRHGPLCKCGNTGCLESIASGTAIARRAREAILAGNYFTEPPVLPLADQLLYADPPAVAQAASEGLPAAAAIINDTAEALGIGLINILHIFNPEKIILGGGLLQIGDLLLRPALQLVQERAMTVPSRAVEIVYAQLGENTGLIGAGSLVYYHQAFLFPTSSF